MCLNQDQINIFMIVTLVFAMLHQNNLLSVSILSSSRIHCASKIRRKSYAKDGVLGLDDSRFNNSSRPKVKELITDEIIARKDAEIEYLEAQLELIKKLELEEMQVINNKSPSFRIFNIIKDTIHKFNLSNMVKHLCKVVKVSRSGYYRYISYKKQNKFT